MYTCTLNNSTYDVAITFIRVNGSVRELPLDHILKLSITNDSFNPFPRAQIIVKDPIGSIMPEYTADNKSKVLIQITSQEQYGDNIKTIEQSHLYNVNRVKPLSFAGQDNTYSIDVVSEYLTNWLKPIAFSTGSNTDLTATDIACNLLNKADIPYRLPTNSCKYQTSFISDINSPVKDHIQRLLDLASINGGGFYYTWYDNIENELVIDSIKNIISNNGIAPFNSFAAPCETTAANEYFTPRSIEYTNDVTASKINKISRGFSEFKFDHINGEFKHNRLLYLDIVNGSTISELDAVIDNTINIEDNINYAQFAGAHTWFNDIRKAVRTYNGMQLTILGSLERKIGDLISITSDSTLHHTFGGLWMNMRTTDEYIFGSNKYEQKILMSKVGKVKQDD